MNEKEILLVQVKSNYKKNIGKIKAFKNHPKFIKKIIAVKKDRGEWKEFKV